MSSKSTFFRFQPPVNDSYELHEVNWINGAQVSTAMTAVLGSDDWRVYPRGDGWQDERRLSDAVDLDRFPDQWAEVCNIIVGNARQRSDLIYLDMEHLPTDFGKGTDCRYAVALAQAFRDQAPGLRLACYAFPLGLGIPTNEKYIVYAKSLTATKSIKASIDSLKPLAELLDFIDLGAYLLQASQSDRDLSMISALRRVARKFFPSLKLIFSAMGQYQYQEIDGQAVEWGKAPGSEVINPAILKKYAANLTRYGDDVTLFDLQSPRDDFFVEELKRLVNA